VPSGELNSTARILHRCVVRNWASYGDGVTLGPEFPEWQRHLHTDPQTSGRLLIACDAAHGDAIAQQVASEGYPFARTEEGPPAVKVLD
jgi:selenide, water dikinase